MDGISDGGYLWRRGGMIGRTNLYREVSSFDECEIQPPQLNNTETCGVSFIIIITSLQYL